MSEFLVLMEKNATAEHFNSAVGAVTAGGGRVTQRFPMQAFIAEGGENVLNMVRGREAVAGVYTGPVDNPRGRAMDEAAALVLQAWNLRHSDEYAQSKASRPDDGKPWDFHQSRGGCNVPVEDAGSPFATAEIEARATPTNTSRYLIGTVAVAVVIVDGPAGSAAEFTPAERTNVVAEVQEGVSNLIALAPAGANLNFVYDTNTVALTLDPATVSGEGDWRDPAMAVLGYAAGSSGMYDYLQFLRTARWPALSSGPDWAYIAFFTKYNVSWFAYASIGGPRLVMQYSNDGWGPNQIDRVFAHESGHIFGAPDEYASSGCAIGGSWGYLGVANGNCANSNPGSIDCLMKGNTYSACPYTVGHFGWRDSDSDATPDPVDLTPGTYATKVGVTPGTPFYNNADLWIRNADDGEMNTAHQNPKSNVDNFIYARVRCTGGATAEVVRTRFHLANFTGTEFVYPSDYTTLITAPDTPYPTLFSLTPGASAITKVRLQQSQIPPATWHPCLLAQVQCAQEASPASGAHVWDSDNLAQKNLVIDYVSPAQTLLIAAILQNVTAERPYFEVSRVRAPASLKVQLQFRDPKVKPQIVDRQRVAAPALRTEVERGTVQSLTSMRPILARVAAVGSGEAGVTLDFSEETDFNLRAGEQDLFLRLAAGSSIRFGNGGVLPANVGNAPAAPLQRFNRTFLQIPSNEVTRFQLALGRKARATAGISFTAPSNARIGDEYRFELVQYNEKGQATGGISFVIRVASPEFVLKEMHWRLDVLRKLGTSTRRDVFAELADKAGALIDQRLSAGRPARRLDAVRREFTRALRASVSPKLWDYPVDALEAGAAEVQQRGFTAELDTIASLLYHAQERLLAEFTSA